MVIFWFGATPGGAQALLLALCSEIKPRWASFKQMPSPMFWPPPVVIICMQFGFKMPQKVNMGA